MKIKITAAALAACLFMAGCSGAASVNTSKNSEPVDITIDHHSEGFRLITRVQDEAHRFAIEYHRSLRSKEQVRSVLDDIKGIGPARRKALMRHFKTIEAVRDAGIEELAGAPQMNRNAAEAVYRFFHGEEMTTS